MSRKITFDKDYTLNTEQAFSFLFKESTTDKKQKTILELYVNNMGQNRTTTPFIKALMSNYSYGGTDFNELSGEFVAAVGILYACAELINEIRIPEDILNNVFKNIDINNISNVKLLNVSPGIEKFIKENFKLVNKDGELCLQMILDSNNVFVFINNFPQCDEFFITNADGTKPKCSRQEIIKKFEFVSSKIEQTGDANELNFKNFIKAIEYFTALSINTTSPCDINPNCDDFGDIYDLSTGNLYIRDNDGNLSYKDGRKVGNWLEDKRCYGLGEVEGDCDDLAFKLLSGNIAQCCDISDSIFDKLTKDVSNMNPGTIEQILKNFGVKTENGPRGQVPTSLEYWGTHTLKSLVSNEIRIEVLKNEKLLKFLKTVIEFAQRNPEILDVNKKLDNSIDNRRTFSLVPKFVPIPPKECNNFNDMYQTVLNTVPRINNPLLGTMIPGTVPYQFNNFNNMYNNMTGGGSNLEPTAQLLNSMYNNILLRFERSGCALNQQDKDKIKCAIEKLSRLETNLQKVLRDLQIYSEVERNCTGASVSLKDIEDRDITRLRESVSQMTNTMNTNLYKQSDIIKLLMDKIFKQLYERFMGQIQSPVFRFF